MKPIPPFAEQIVSDKLQSTGPCFLDHLVRSIPALTWGEVFTTVARMANDGRVRVRQVGFVNYRVEPLPQLLTPSIQDAPVINFQSARSPDQPT